MTLLRESTPAAPRHGSTAVTNGIRVTAQPRFDIARSDPARKAWVFRYEIEMRNEGTETVKLRRRTWQIIDGKGVVHEVKGEGVVGEFPVLGAGQRFAYESFCPLSTPWGTMEGELCFTFGDEDVEKPGAPTLDVKVARFYLVADA